MTDTLLVAALMAASLLVAFIAGAIFGAATYASGRERSSPMSIFARKAATDDKIPQSAAERDAQYERDLRKKTPVKA